LFLRRLTVTGFKSFATKTTIDFERGITGVVGPNGSGKSNMADAIRWAMGEQSRSKLRLGERDEVVYAGTDTRAKSSFAEVVLLFDNEDGAFALDLTEVEISRRLYRSGETIYKIAGRAVRLSDIQALLAQAGVGASTYAVVGQGMIDSMLLSSPAERKLLFDEAAGIRGPELGREAALRKLSATATNLTRLRDIAAELEPRLSELTTAVATSVETSQLSTRVGHLRELVVASMYTHWSGELKRATAELAVAARKLHRLRHRLREQQLVRALFDAAQAESLMRRQQLTTQLASLEQNRDHAAASLSQYRAALAEARRNLDASTELSERLESINADLAAASNRLEETRGEIMANAEGADRAARAVDKASREVAAAQSELVAIRNGTGDGARDQYLDHALALLKTLAIGLGSPELTTDKIRLMVHKAGRLLSHATRSGAAELLAELKSAQKHLEAAMTKRETAVEHQTNISITRRSIEIDLAHQELDLTRLTSSRDDILARLASLEPISSQIAELVSAELTSATLLKEVTDQLERQRMELASLSLEVGSSSRSALVTSFEHSSQALETLQTLEDSLIVACNRARQKCYEAVTCARDWGVEIEPYRGDQSQAQLADQLARAEARLEALNQHREERIDQFQEVSDRSTALAAQIADLETAQTDLGHLVTELDGLIRSRFNDAFQSLARQFALYFERLFEGGSASLELTDSPDGRYGIAIKASPKGKRMTQIAALSGGERALAGVALVAAIMRVNPSPFVVLDEIDAALDEVNSGRLATILAELAEYSQLIVITHNRQTMRAARVLFGVAPTEHHSSRIISMRLEQATQLAAR
jgi:chromosome segregation ATPase